MVDHQTPAELLELIRAEQCRRWLAGQRVYVETLLAEYPGIRAQGDDLLKIVYQEVLLREEHGETPGLAEYVQRFPQLTADLGPLFEVHLALETSLDLVDDATAADPDELPALTDLVIPGYEVLGELGRGGMGVVFRARHLSLGRDVALKVISSGARADAEALARLRAEAQVLARLQHPHIVQVFEVGEAAGHAYFAMEFVEGGSLDRALARRPQEPGRTAALVETVARAMHAAHQRGVIHRDLKPANVLLTADGTPKVTDFGLARRQYAEAAATGEAANGRTILGTPSYMAPEQVGDPAAPLGPAADVYALGALLYEMLTGRPPFVGVTALETLLQVRAGNLLPPRRLQPAVPGDLETICLKSLAREPERRYSTAESLAEDLRRWLDGEPIQARPVSRAERTVKWARRRPAVAALVAALVLAVVALLGGGVWFTLQLRAERDLARREQATAQAAQVRAEASYQLARTGLEEISRRLSDDPRLQSGPLEDLRRLVLEAEARFYESYLAYRDAEPGFHADRGRTLLRLAHVIQELGSPETALAQVRTAATAFQELHRQYPEELDYQANLARCHHSHGTLCDLLGRCADAEAQFQQACRMRRTLAEQPTAPADARADLTDSLLSLARLYARMGRHQEAIQTSEQTLALCWTALKLSPANARSRADLAQTYHNLGVHYRSTGRPAEAERVLRAALALRRQLAADTGHAPRARMQIAETLQDMGELYRVSLGRTAEAEVHFQAAVELRQRLVEQHPLIPSYRADLAACRNGLASLLATTSRNEEAERIYRESATALTTLSTQYPAVPRYRTELARSWNDLGTLQLRLKRPEEGEAAYQTALSLEEDLVRAHPKIPEYRSSLALTWINLGNVYLRTSRPTEAEASYRKAAALSEALTQQHPTAATFALVRGFAETTLGAFHQKRGELEAALAWFTRGADVLEPLFRQQPRHGMAWMSLAGARCNLARLHSQLGQHAAAVTACERALALNPLAAHEMLCLRALALAHLGEFPRALAEADRLSRNPHSPATTYCDCARIYALAAAHSADDASAFAERAVALVRQALARDFVDIDKLRSDADLAALQARSDFQQLLSDRARGVKPSLHR